MGLPDGSVPVAVPTLTGSLAGNVMSTASSSFSDFLLCSDMGDRFPVLPRNRNVWKRSKFIVLTVAKGMIVPHTQNDRAKTSATGHGWMVEAVVPAIGSALVRRRYIFAVGVDDARRAERLVRIELGGVHCVIAAKIRLAPRALAQFNIDPDCVEQLSGT